MRGACSGPTDWRGLPIKRPYPWERHMTVCIAAICDQGPAKGKIVICADLLVSGALGGSETMLKALYIVNGWKVLVSGTESSIRALVKRFTQTFRTVQKIDHTNLDSLIKHALQARRRDLAEELIQTEFSIPYDEFLQHGKERLPADTFYDAVQRIRRQDLGAELIVCGFSDGFPEIYHCDASGKAHPMDCMSTIGEGQYLAASVLNRRGQQNITPLSTTVYNVYEAKRYAEGVRSVGTKTMMLVMSEGDEGRLVGNAATERLKQLYMTYGPKDTPTTVEIGAPLYYDEETQLIGV